MKVYIQKFQNQSLVKILCPPLFFQLFFFVAFVPFGDLGLPSLTLHIELVLGKPKATLKRIIWFQY